MIKRFTKTLNRQSLKMGAAFTLGMMGITDPAHANGGGGTNFDSIAGNIIDSIKGLPGLITGLSYLAGTLLGALGILKIKDHVENPSQTPLKEGAIRLLAGGGLFALPIIFEAMQTTLDKTGVAAPEMDKLQAVTFEVDGS